MIYMYNIYDNTIYIYIYIYIYIHDSNKKQVKNSILPTAGGKVKNAQNHRRIDARGEAEGIKPVICGILYYRVRWVYYFIALPGRKVESLLCAA